MGILITNEELFLHSFNAAVRAVRRRDFLFAEGKMHLARHWGAQIQDSTQWLRASELIGSFELACDQLRGE